MSDLPLQEDAVPQVFTNVIFHLSKKDWYTHHPPLFEVIKDRVLAGSLVKIQESGTEQDRLYDESEFQTQI